MYGDIKPQRDAKKSVRFSPSACADFVKFRMMILPQVAATVQQAYVTMTGIDSLVSRTERNIEELTK